MYNNIDGIRSYIPEETFDTSIIKFNHEIAKDYAIMKAKLLFIPKFIKTIYMKEIID